MDFYPLLSTLSSPTTTLYILIILVLEVISMFPVLEQKLVNPKLVRVVQPYGIQNPVKLQAEELFILLSRP